MRSKPRDTLAALRVPLPLPPGRLELLDALELAPAVATAVDQDDLGAVLDAARAILSTALFIDERALPRLPLLAGRVAAFRAAIEAVEAEREAVFCEAVAQARSAA